MLQLWDLGSSIGSASMAANYIHGCHAVLLVYDITQQQASAQQVAVCH